MDSLRIVVKPDAEAGFNKGARLYAEHFESPMVQLISTMARKGKALIQGAEVLRITEGYRPQRIVGRRDLHTQLRAIDFTIVKQGGIRATMAEYVLLAETVRAILGDADYDFLVHGEGAGLHIHAEFDPKIPGTERV